MPSVADFLVERLANAGAKHVFGVSGEFVANFFRHVQKSEGIELVTTADEVGAAHAADAYARLNGIGCVAITYNTGALKIVNAVAGAYAERSPIVVISGAPAHKQRHEILQHMVHSYGCQQVIFSNITCSSIVLDDPTKAGYLIDKAIEEMKHHKQPIYIELPHDIAELPLTYDVYRLGTPDRPQSDPQNLEEATQEAMQWISESKQPVILAGVEIARFDLGEQLVKFAERANIAVATTLLSKGVMSERHPLYLGSYDGCASQPGVQEAVESADCLIILGVVPGDTSATGLPAKMKKRNVICSTVEDLHIKNHNFSAVRFDDFVESLFKLSIPKKQTVVTTGLPHGKPSFKPIAKAKLTIARLFEKVNSAIRDNVVVLADSGNSMYGAAELVMPDGHSFLASAIYPCVGKAIPGALGAGLAKPDHRPVVFVGDGAFQSSLSELGTIARRRLKPIVVVLNNGCYGREKIVCDGPYNRVNNWNYERVVEMIGEGTGVRVETEEEWDVAFDKALASDSLWVINAILPAGDTSPALCRVLQVKMELE